MGQKVCGLPCAVQFAEKSRREQARKAQKKRDKERLESLKSLTDHKADTQRLFNQYIRLRDAYKPCVSCGQSAFRGQRHASHYRTRAAAPQLSLNFLAVHSSCAQCNSMKSGNVLEYRIELVRRIGEARVLALEHNNEPANFTVEYLKRFQKILRRRIKHYKKLRNQ